MQVRVHVQVRVRVQLLLQLWDGLTVNYYRVLVECLDCAYLRRLPCQR